jgi:ABC-type cobalt transport system, permease component.
MGFTHKILAKFSLFDLVIIAMMASLGIAVKTVIVPLTHIITGVLFIPGGAAAGGLYMMWLVLAVGITGKPGAATLTGFVQALVVMSTGITGSHGALSLLTYTVPGIMADLGLLIIGHRVCCVGCAFLAGLMANAAGTALVNLAYFRLPLIPLVLSLSTAALSGGLGGIIAHKILKQYRKFRQVGDPVPLTDSGNTQ